MGFWLGSLLMTSCLVGPNYQPPDLALPEQYHLEAAASVSIDSAHNVPEQWWYTFKDPVLNALIEQAVLKNFNAQEALTRIDEFRADCCIAGSYFYPNMFATAGYSRIKLNNTLLGGQADQNAFNAWSYGAKVASWEIDVFGKIRRAVEAASGAYQASVEEYKQVLLVVRADVANGFVAIRALQQQQQLLQTSIELLRQQLAIAESQLLVGTVSAIDVAEVAAELALRQSEVQELQAQLTKQLNALSVLIGEYPGQLAHRLGVGQAVPIPQLDMRLGVPAQLLLQRPDVRAAEQRMIAEVAGIGVAEANLYPDITLSGTFAMVADTVGNLASSSAITYALGPLVNWNFFAGGRNRAKLQKQQAKAKVAEISYRQTVLQAVAQVEDATNNVGYSYKGLESLQEASSAAQYALQLLKSQLSAGRINVQAVLEAERAVVEVERELVKSQALYALAAIQLYRSLGTGSQLEPPHAVTCPSADVGSA